MQAISRPGGRAVDAIAAGAFPAEHRDSGSELDSDAAVGALTPIASAQRAEVRLPPKCVMRAACTF